MHYRVSEARLAAIRVVNHVIETHPYGSVGGSVTVATVNKDNDQWKAEFMPPGEIEGHIMNYSNAVKEMAKLLGPD